MTRIRLHLLHLLAVIDLHQINFIVSFAPQTTERVDVIAMVKHACMLPRNNILSFPCFSRVLGATFRTSSIRVRDPPPLKPFSDERIELGQGADAGRWFLMWEETQAAALPAMVEHWSVAPGKVASHSKNWRHKYTIDS